MTRWFAFFRGTPEKPWHHVMHSADFQKQRWNGFFWIFFPLEVHGSPQVKEFPTFYSSIEKQFISKSLLNRKWNPTWNSFFSIRRMRLSFCSSTEGLSMGKMYGGNSSLNTLLLMKLYHQDEMIMWFPWIGVHPATLTLAISSNWPKRLTLLCLC